MASSLMNKRLLPVMGLALLAGGFVAGKLFSGGPAAPAPGADERRILYYVDPMNPAHTSAEPGLAPCGMKMEPVYAGEAALAPAGQAGAVLPGTVRVTPEKQQLIGVVTGVVERRALVAQRRLLGQVAVDETREFEINATVDGWITQALPVATGDRVTNGQILATFYSPEFLSAGQALLFALNSQDRVHATGNETQAQQNQITQFNLNLQQYRDSLRNLGMGDTQIEEMMQSREFAQRVNIVAPADGYVSARNVSGGLRFEKGTVLFRISDLSRVWILADVFERDAALVRVGSAVRVSLPQQGRSLAAWISEALPQFDAVARTLKVRIEADNPEVLLRPGMFVDVEISAPLPETLVVPAEAVLDAGLRQTVFVDRGGGLFEPRVIATGERSGGWVQVLRGLMAGETIAVSGHFLLDSESRMKLAAEGVHGTPRVDPVCGMAVDEPKARADGRAFDFQGSTFFFCNEGCKQEFAADPGRFLEPGIMLPERAVSPGTTGARPTVVNQDPVCAMEVNESQARAAGRVFDHGGRTYLFCGDGCKETFAANPARFLKSETDSAARNAPIPHRDQSNH